MIVDCAHYVDGVRADAEPLGLREAGRRARESRGFLWLALEDPTREELEELRLVFDLPPLAVEDAHEGHQRPKLEEYGESTFIVVKTVLYDAAAARVDFAELDVFVGPHYAIAAGWRNVQALAGARERLDRRPEIASLGPMAAAWATLDAVIDEYEPVLDRLADDLAETEQAVFEQPVDQGERIYLQHRQAALVARAVYPLLGVFHELEDGEPVELPERLVPLLRDVGDHVRRLHEEVTTLGEALDALLNANLARVTVRQNVVLQQVSGWAAIAIVPTIITGIYGMNFRHMPELGWRAGYPLVVGVMVTVILVLRWYFKRVGWF